MAISVKGVKLWSDLNTEYPNIKSLQKFKKVIKKMIILMIIINDYNYCFS